MNNLGGAVVILEKDNKVLLLLRKAGDAVGTWELPAGHIKDGESPEETAVREVREETGLEIGDLSLVEVVDGVTHIFRASIIGGTLENREPDQHEQIAWWPADTLPKPLGPSAAHILQQ